MRYTIRSIFLLALSCALAAPAVRAAVLDHLPRNAMAFVHVKSLAAADEKFTSFIHVFNRDFPSPLAMVRSVLRLQQGIDENGDALVAFLGTSTVVPSPLVLLPVTSYEDFARAVGADKSGEVCRVRVASVEILAARLDQHVLFMNVEDRSLMQQFLSGTLNAPQAKELEPWFQENDLSVCVTQLGLGLLAKPEAIRQLSTALGANDDQTPTFLEQGEASPQPLAVSHLLRARFRQLAVGLMRDEAGNSRCRLAALPNHRRPQLPTADAPEAAPLDWEGLPADDYLTLGTGRFPAGTGQIFAEVFTLMAQDDAQATGRGRFSNLDWAKEKQSWQLAFAGVQEAALRVQSPGKDEPLLATCCLRLKVQDSAAYLKSLEQSFEIANALEAKSESDIKLIFEATPHTFGAQEGLLLESDLDKATGDENVVYWQELLTALTGPEHKFSIYCLPVDDHQVFVGIESKQQLEEFVQASQSHQAPLEGQNQSQQTLELLEGDATWKQLIDPRELVEYTQSAVERLNVFGFMLQLPIYSTAPPWGISVGGDSTIWKAEVVMPKESAEALATFVAEVSRILGGE